MEKVAIMIAYRDRPTELSLLLQSLRTQTYQNFDIFIRDDMSGTPLNNYHFFNCLVNRLIEENHKVFLFRNDFPHGVSKNRQRLVDDVILQQEKQGDYPFMARLDDDVILQQDYLERLIKVIKKGYDLASGVTVTMLIPIQKRDPKFLKGIANRIILDKEGKYIFNGDDCGIEYLRSEIIPAHHFRSCALYKTEIHKKVNYLPTKLTKHGFREEQIFSYKLLMAGYKIGVDTNAINYHQLTPSGGERFIESNELINQNQKILEEFTKEHKDKLNKIFKPIKMTKQELMKEVNLSR